MKIAILALAMLLLPTTTRADNPLPPVPEGGLMVVMESGCTDTATGIKGYCVMSQDREGNIYVIFAVDGVPVEIRQVQGEGYTVIWSAVAEVAMGELL